MKKFTCLLVALLATQMIIAACPAAATADAAGNSFYALLADTPDFTGTTPAGVVGTSVAADANFCGNVGTCCTIASLRNFVNVRLQKLKDALTTYGTAVSKFGGYLTKISAVANNTNLSTYLSSSATDLLLTEAQAKAFLTQYSTPSTYTADFTAFTSQLVECFDFYKSAYQKIACDACIEGTAAATRMRVLQTKGQATYWQGGGANNKGVGGVAGVNDVGEIKITQASCSEWVNKCNKVWTFLHRVGGAVHVAAYINKKRDSSKPNVGTFGAAYVVAADATAVTAVIDAFGRCAADASVATCTVATDKPALCRAFIRAFDSAAPMARLDVANLNADPTSSYPTARRQLVTASSGRLLVDAGSVGVDLTSANTALTGLPATGAVTFTSSDYSAWSAGYVSPSSSSSTSSKSAKVFIGTILSALFAVAFLN